MRYRCVSQDGRVYHVHDSECRLNETRAAITILRTLRRMQAPAGDYRVYTQSQSGYVSDRVMTVRLEVAE